VKIGCEERDINVKLMKMKRVEFGEEE
jgi:hypothetical protein